jgi:phosphopantetheinyl transferase (holo-ACP synthase)
MIGIDLVSIGEFRRGLEIGGANLARRAFAEAAVPHREVEQLARTWAAKEAVHKPSDAPTHPLSGVMTSPDAPGLLLASLDEQRLAVSLSRTAEYVVAPVMRLEK